MNKNKVVWIHDWEENDSIYINGILFLEGQGLLRSPDDLEKIFSKFEIEFESKIFDADWYNEYMDKYSRMPENLSEVKINGENE